MRTKRPNKSELSALIAKQYEVLAQHAHERRPVLEFLGKSDRPPITAQELAHRRPGADSVEDLVLLRRGSIHMDSVIVGFGGFAGFGRGEQNYKIVRPINGFDNRACLGRCRRSCLLRKTCWPTGIVVGGAQMSRRQRRSHYNRTPSRRMRSNRSGK